MGTLGVMVLGYGAQSGAPSYCLRFLQGEKAQTQWGSQSRALTPVGAGLYTAHMPHTPSLAGRPLVQATLPPSGRS